MEKDETLLLLAEDQYRQIHHELQEMISFVEEGEIHSQLFPNGSADFEVAFDLMLQKSLLEIAFLDSHLTEREASFLSHLFDGMPSLIALVDPDRPRFEEHTAPDDDIAQRLSPLNTEEGFVKRIAPMYMNFAYINEVKEKDYTAILTSFLSGVVTSFIAFGADTPPSSDFMKNAHLILKTNFFTPITDCKETIAPIVAMAKALNRLKDINIVSGEDDEFDLDALTKKEKIKHTA